MTLSIVSEQTQIRMPDGMQTNLDPEDTAFVQTDMPGHYTIESVDGNRLFAINLPAKESRTAVMPIEDLEQYGISLSQTESFATERPELSSDLQSSATKRQSDLAGLEYEQKLWRWVFVALLAVSLVEIGLAGWLTRAPSETEGEQT